MVAFRSHLSHCHQGTSGYLHAEIQGRRLAAPSGPKEDDALHFSVIFFLSSCKFILHKDVTLTGRSQTDLGEKTDIGVFLLNLFL